MSKYKGRREIAITVLIPMIFFVFLSLHFKVWSGNYTEGDLESVVVQYMDSIHRGNRKENVKTEEESLRLFDYAYLSCAAIWVCLPYICRTGACPAYYVFLPCITLCSLSVRMND